jgi:hypothetical protein
LRSSSGKTQTAEVAAGSGYLAQSTAVLTFGCDAEKQQETTIEIRWPDGTRSAHQVPAGQQDVIIPFPRIARNKTIGLIP